MSNASRSDIQRALNAIRSALDDANQQTRLEVLQLMLAQSQSIVAMARKLHGAQASKEIKRTAKQREADKHFAVPSHWAKQQPIKRADNRSIPSAAPAPNPIEPLPPQLPN